MIKVVDVDEYCLIVLYIVLVNGGIFVYVFKNIVVEYFI